MANAFSPNAGVVIVGAGQAGAEVASALRQSGYEHSIHLLGDEPHPPYRRPPLSKEYLAGDISRDQLLVKPAEAYAKLDIDLHVGCSVESIDRQQQLVKLADGRSLPYDKLVLATGGTPRALPLAGSQADNLYYIRNIEDIDRLKRDWSTGARLAVIGGGYIGLETAAVAVEQGLKVTVVEQAGRLLERVAAPEMSEYYARLHQGRGVHVLTDTQVLALEGAGRITALTTSAGMLEVDLVVVGIGLIPNISLAKEAGLQVVDAICTDTLARTSDPNILAVGDCASFPSAFYDRQLRLESVQNAQEQARAAAATIMGQEKPYDPIPWFWSDQYGLKLQMVGLSRGYDQVVSRGSMESNVFSMFYLSGDCVIAVDTIGRPQDFLMGKRLIAARVPVTAEQLADADRPLKSLL